MYNHSVCFGNMMKILDEPSNAFIHINLSEIIFEKPGAQIKIDVILSQLRQD